MTSDPSRNLPANLVVYESRGCRLIMDFHPVAIVTLGDGSGQEDYVGLLEAIATHVFASREPYVVITDTRGMGRAPNGDMRRRISEWMREHEEGHTSIGAVTIASSPVIRGALTALYWLFPPVCPQAVVGTWSEARDWTVDRLLASSITPPPALLAARTQPY